jgi:predicted metal-dependent phosphoesterase TrpH
MDIADLHIHSNFSDGSDSIEELAKKIENVGIKIFALTDHDTIEGCEKMASKIASGIKFIPSIELTCNSNGLKCHILGYNCDYKNKKLLNHGPVTHLYRHSWIYLYP